MPQICLLQHISVMGYPQNLYDIDLICLTLSLFDHFLGYYVGIKQLENHVKEFPAADEGDSDDDQADEEQAVSCNAAAVAANMNDPLVAHWTTNTKDDDGASRHHV